MALPAAIMAVATVGSAAAQVRATNAQVDSQKKALRSEQRTAELENARRARRAVAARRIQEAELIQAGASQGARSSSGIEGAVGSLRTQTAANIGGASTQLAGSIATNRIMHRGARRAALYGNIAAGFDTVGSLAGVGIQQGVFTRNQTQPTLTRDVPQINPTLTLRS